MVEVALPTTPEEKAKAIDAAVKDIEKEYGKGAIIDMHQKVGKPIPCVPTGIWGIDYNVLGIGGFARGRIIEVYGAEASGKTSLCLTSIASAQKTGGRAAYIDSEHALNANWAATLGVNIDDVFISQPDYGEQALKICQRLLESMAFDIIVVDSVAALVPKAELDGEMGDSHMALQARLMSQAMRMLNGVVSKSNCVLLFVNQIRTNLGVTYGSSDVTPGGKALRFYASQRLDLRRIGSIKKGDEIVGNRVRIKGAKNKCAPPFKEQEVDILFDRGFDIVGNLIDAAVDAGIVKKSGAWYSLDDERLGQGKDAARDLLESNDELLQSVVTRLQL